MKVSDYLDKKGFEYEIIERPSGTNYVMICPFCKGGEKKEKKFAINENGLWNCKRVNHCGLSGTFYQLQQRLGDDPQILNISFKKKSKKQKYNLPKKGLTNLKLSTEWRNWLNNRKIKNEFIDKFKLFTGIKGELCLPYFKNNKLVNIKHRTIRKEFWQEKNCEPTLYNIDYINGDEILIITEGELDCISLIQYGVKNVVSINSGVNDQRWIENEWDFLKKFKEIYLIFDNDQAGQSDIRNIAIRLGVWRCKNIILPFKDVNECLINNIVNEEIFEYFKKSKEFTPLELRKSSDFCTEVIDIFNDKDKYAGKETGIPELTEILGGWRKGEVTVWSGQCGSGKTTLLNQLMLFQASRGIKSCIASLELKASRYLKWAICQVIGDSNPSNDQIEQAFEWMGEYIYIINVNDTIPPNKLLEIGEYAAMKYGIEHFVIDSLMNVKLEDESLSQINFIHALHTFAENFNVHCHLVAHPRKQEKDTDTPDKTDVKGRGEITDKADNVIILWRNIKNMEYMEDNNIFNAMIYVKKNRELGILKSIKLSFNQNSRRFKSEKQIKTFY